ncbi:hypothetical protein KUTeg_009559 [Tegillarca granosa]|uniref:Ion transport domain-containing protein n=1 Tax=Tegillarca granosa TaxID=220873 RepID=A0ABQ9F488_TEGGR|nr:hypothetical protein KUTeg_009559 [Tegillarca granosa]
MEGFTGTFYINSCQGICNSIIDCETLPYFDSIAIRQHGNITNADIRGEFNIFNMGNRNEYHILLIIDHGCNLFFFCEFILKFLASPNKLKFIKIPMTIVELLCLIPYYLAVFIVYLHPDPKSIFFVIRILFATRLLRIFRIFVLMKHNLALKVLVYTIKASTRELLLLLLVVIIGVIIFASLEFYMEVFGNAEDVEINHIPMALWWALITMTTVGYGDFVPKSGPGYAVGAICATSGVLVIALSVPAIVNNFTLYYQHAKCRLKLRQRKRKFHLNIWQKLTDTALKGKSGGESEKPLLARVAEMAKKERMSKSSVAPLKERHNDANDGKNPSSSTENKNSTKEEKLPNNNNEIIVEEKSNSSQADQTKTMELLKQGDSRSKLESQSTANKTLPELKRTNVTNGLHLSFKETNPSDVKETDDNRNSRSSTVADDNTMDLKSIN